MKKYHVISVSALAAVMVLTAGPGSAYAKEAVKQNDAQSVLTYEASGQSGMCGDNTRWTLDADGVLTLSGEGAVTSNPWIDYKNDVRKVIVKAGVTDVKCSRAFFNCDEVTEAVFEYGTRIVGAQMFEGCDKLAKVELPDTILEIRYGAFMDCDKLIDIVLPYGVKYIDDRAFEGCPLITKLTIPNTVKTISSIKDLAAFDKNVELEVHDDSVAKFYAEKNGYNYTVIAEPSLSEVQSGKCGYNATWTLGTDGVLTISGQGEMLSHQWVKYRNSITKVIVNDGITNVCDDAFEAYSMFALPDGREISNVVENFSIETVVLADSVQSIGKRAFGGCRVLSRVNIPNGISKIEDETFAGCYKLESIDIPDSVTEIGEKAFTYAGLINLELPNNLKVIRRYAFNRSGQGKGYILIPDSVEEIEEGAFNGCGFINVVVPGSVKEINEKTFREANSKRITLEEGVQIIRAGAFAKPNSLSRVYIPKSVTYIEETEAHDTFDVYTNMYVYEGSYAQKFAEENGYSYVIRGRGLKRSRKDGNWYYYDENDNLDTTYRGLVYANNRWWYVENGTINFTYTGMAYGNGRWWYMKDGAIDFKYTGMAYGNGRWWYFNNGAIDFKYTGMAYGNGRWWYFNNGAIDFKYTGTAYYKQWWYFSNGALNFKYTGMGYANNNWWMFQNGAINFKYTGIGQNKSGKWYFRNGQIAWKYSGNVTYGGKTYKVQNGKVMG